MRHFRDDGPAPPMRTDLTLGDLFERLAVRDGDRRVIDATRDRVGPPGGSLGDDASERVQIDPTAFRPIEYRPPTWRARWRGWRCRWWLHSWRLRARVDGRTGQLELGARCRWCGATW